jgi:uncharacterized repeat protein (TIGR03806 family)
VKLAALIVLIALAAQVAFGTTPNSIAASERYGLEHRPAAKAYLSMPSNAGGTFPLLLSETGAFADTRKAIPSPALIPYDLIVPFWSDGAEKMRWISVPDGQKIQFAPTGEWVFPAGTVFVKTFVMPMAESNPVGEHRLETRLLVCDSTGGVYGVVYKWRADNSDADLLCTNLTEPISVHSNGRTKSQSWYYPNRQDCLVCHTANAHYVLGVKTRQLNREFGYPSGSDNQLRAWSHIGLFDTNLAGVALKSLPTLAAIADTTRSFEDRARSYLDANCAQCHRPSGTVAYFDARFDTPFAEQKLIDGRVLIDERIDNSRVVAPHDIWRSILFMRANTTESFKMPPLARNMIDERGMGLLRLWIDSMPGPTVVPPPTISPPGGNFNKPLNVILTSEPGATIHYTLDGTVPTASDLQYEKPILLHGPTILRAKAYKPGWKKSITSQEIYLIGR